MTKTLTALTILLVSTSSFAKEFSIIKPITAYHYYDRSHPTGKDWNENYWDSIGVGYRDSSGIGGQVIYANENSINKESWYLHGEYMYKLHDNINIGIALGGRTGYTEPVKLSGGVQVENCIEKYCTLIIISDRVSVLNLKYKF